MNPAEKLKEAHRLLLKHFGRPDIKEHDPLAVLIKTILSQNTSDLNRDRAYNALMERFGSFENVLNADVSDIEDAIRVGGLAVQKARTIKRALQWVKETFRRLDLTPLCDDPDAEKKLTSIKGVGVKTARVTLLFGCKQDRFPIDTHIFRVLKRLGVIPPNVSREKAHEMVDGIIEPDVADVLHLNLIRLGREICRSNRPKCDICPLQRICQYASNSVSGR